MTLPKSILSSVWSREKEGVCVPSIWSLAGSRRRDKGKDWETRRGRQKLLEEERLEMSDIVRGEECVGVGEGV